MFSKDNTKPVLIQLIQTQNQLAKTDQQLQKEQNALIEKTNGLLESMLEKLDKISSPNLSASQRAAAVVESKEILDNLREDVKKKVSPATTMKIMLGDAVEFKADSAKQVLLDFVEYIFTRPRYRSFLIDKEIIEVYDPKKKAVHKRNYTRLQDDKYCVYTQSSTQAKADLANKIIEGLYLDFEVKIEEKEQDETTNEFNHTQFN